MSVEVEEEDKSFNRTVVVCLILLAIVFGGYCAQNYISMPGQAPFPAFLFGVAMVVLNPVGWLLAALAAWIVIKLFGSTDSHTEPDSAPVQSSAASTSPQARFGTIPPEWLSSGRLGQAEIRAMRDQAYSSGVVYPPPGRVFRAFWHTRPRDVSVVIIGSDPYPNHGHADGLAFSAKNATPLPPTLNEIFDELHRDLGGPRRTKGNLSDWAKQGVLLLNTSLTVQPSVDEWINRSNAERHARTWRPLIEAAIDMVSSSHKPVAFVLLGRPAQDLFPLIPSRNFVLETSHPSPRAAMSDTRSPHFSGSSPFSQVNSFLAASGRPTIDWLD